MKPSDYEKYGELYAHTLHYLENNEIDPAEIVPFDYFNDWLKTKLE